MRIAVIDCGTNTFHLLIAEVVNEKVRFIVRKKRVVKLASGRLQPDEIAPAAFEKAIGIMTEYRHLIAKYKAGRVLTAGTAAFRDAKNGKALLKAIEYASGIKVELISGSKEAELICEGVQAAVHPQEKVSLIMDIGGGSTEFILCSQRRILWKQSFRLGAARLLQELQPSDPFTAADVRNLNKYLEKELQALLDALPDYEPEILIGASGSFETFASILLHQENKPDYLRGKTHYSFSLKDYKHLHQELLKSTYSERLKIPGMLRMRADMIVMASLLLTFVLRKSRIRKLELSAYALKEGLLQRELKKQNHG